MSCGEDEVTRRVDWCDLGWSGVSVVWCCVVCSSGVVCVRRGLVCDGVMRCSEVWCGVVWCGVVSCGVGWCGVVWCDVVWCDVVWCHLKVKDIVIRKANVWHLARCIGIATALSKVARVRRNREFLMGLKGPWILVGACTVRALPFALDVGVSLPA